MVAATASSSSRTHEIKHELLAALAKDQLELPVLPEVALRIREVADHPDVDVNKLSRAVGQDPALSARLVKVANSPLLRGSQNIENVNTAIARLGIAFSANLATGFAMEQMFQATSDGIDRLLRETWNRSTQIAAMCTVLASTYTKLKPDQAMLAGLTHAIGTLPVLAWAENDERLSEDTPLLCSVIDSIQADIGVAILTSWEFPAELIRVPVQHAELTRPVDKPDYAALVTVANLQVRAGSNHPLAKVDWHTVPAFLALGVNLDNTDSLNELAGQLAASMH